VSALAIDVPVTFVLEAAAAERTTAPTRPVASSHPRGRGFRVLSRIARVQASDAGYVPRHRLDVPGDALAV
jgi:hypothetical protein